ncbi:hypothetical protein ACWD5F_06115 [Streptomyces sp. NPDC002499]
MGGLALGLVVAVLLVYLPVRHGVMFAGTAFGLCLLTGVLAGEILTAPPAGSVRTASLSPRRIPNYLSRAHNPLLGTLLFTLIGLLAITTAIASSRMSSRGVRLVCGDSVSTDSGWIGLPAAVATVATVIVGSGACLLVLRKIVSRPALTDGPEGHGLDEAQRVTSASAVTYAWGCMMSASLFTSALHTSTSLPGAFPLSLFDRGLDESCSTWWLEPLQVATFTLAIAAAVALVYLLARLANLAKPHQGATA